MSRSPAVEAVIPSRTQRGVVLHFAEIHRSAHADRVRSRVKLERAGRGFYIGTAEVGESSLADVQCAAQATLQALGHAIGDAAPVVLELREAEILHGLGHAIVMVSLTATVQGRNRDMVGFSPLNGDAATSAARAILDATNRLLGMG
jgi:hypothetical protein